MLLGNHGEAQAGPAISNDRNTIDIKRSSADSAAIELGSAHASSDPLDNQGTFELSDRRDNHYDRASQRAVSVDRLTLGKELDAEVVQLVEDLEKVLCGSR
jgi:hypothetical protein